MSQVQTYSGEEAPQQTTGNISPNYLQQPFLHPEANHLLYHPFRLSRSHAFYFRVKHQYIERQWTETRATVSSSDRASWVQSHVPGKLHGSFPRSCGHWCACDRDRFTLDKRWDCCACTCMFSVVLLFILLLSFFPPTSSEHHS